MWCCSQLAADEASRTQVMIKYCFQMKFPQTSYVQVLYFPVGNMNNNKHVITVMKLKDVYELYVQIHMGITN